MAENSLYNVKNGAQSYSPDSQTMSSEPERTVHTDPPPSYSPPQPQPIAGQGYTPGYQQLVNPPQTTTTTTVVMPSQQCVMEMPIRPQNYLVLSILSAIFCCPIFGIIGIVYAAQVDPAFDTGDYNRAMSNSGSARSWTIASFTCGLVSTIVIIILIALSATTSTTTTNYDY